MSPDAIKYLSEGLDSGEITIDDIPRMCYFGHELVGSYELPRRDARWRCVGCKHEWDSFDGWLCPNCRLIKDPPHWLCKECKSEWYGNVGKFCPGCGLNHQM